MTVKELKEYLETLDENAVVLIECNSYTGDMDPLSVNLHLRYYPKITKNKDDISSLSIIP